MPIFIEDQFLISLIGLFISSIVFFACVSALANEFKIVGLLSTALVGGVGFFAIYQSVLIGLIYTELWTTSFYIWHIIPILTPTVGVALISIAFTTRELKERIGEIAIINSIIGVFAGISIIVLISNVLASRLLDYPEGLLYIGNIIYFVTFLIISIYIVSSIIMFLWSMRFVGLESN